MSWHSPYPNAQSPTEKARKWRHKKWQKVRHIEDMCYDNARLIPIYKSGGHEFLLVMLTYCRNK